MFADVGLLILLYVFDFDDFGFCVRFLDFGLGFLISVWVLAWCLLFVLCFGICCFGLVLTCCFRFRLLCFRLA